jgi:hypothetical protein
LLLSVIAAYGLSQVQIRIPATGNVKAIGLGVYSDPDCANTLSNINWGSLSPGENKTFTFYLKSLSTVNSSLILSFGNWEPSLAGSYIGLSWNRNGYCMVPGEVVSAVLLLQVSSSIEGISSFSFDAIITASEA